VRRPIGRRERGKREVGIAGRRQEAIERPIRARQEPLGLGTKKEGYDVLIDGLALARLGGEQGLPELLGDPTQRDDRS
jgi:hypothetical protein